MAERIGTRKRFHPTQEVIEWAGLLDTDTGDWKQVPNFLDKTVTVESGVPGVGFAAAIEGLNRDAPITADSGAQIRDAADGLAIALAAVPDIATLLDSPLWIRPIITGGDGTTNVTIRVHLQDKRGPT